MIPPSSRDLAPGVAFGGYVVRELIGRGGMAAVYRAEHLLLNKPVALKVMNPALLLSPAARQRFLLEGRAAASIKHPNVVDITDVGVHDGAPYLVMELLKGQDLELHLGKCAVMGDGSAIRLALPVIAALHAAHTSGVVHRDIKPSNIFMSIGPDGQVVPKVLDFGISKVSFDDSILDLATTPHHSIIGTPRYLPPEALYGAHELGPLSDQYSLGVVLYQCVTGRTPFSGDTLVSLLNSLSRGAFAPPRQLEPSLSPGLDRVITRALSHEPTDRYPTIRDMGRALLELAAERTQMVWGQSFRTPSEVQETAALARHDVLWPVNSRLPPPTTERLAIDELHNKRRWSAVALGVGLMLVGAVGSAVWVFSPTRDSSIRPDAVRRISVDSPAPLPRPPTLPREETGETKVVVDLTPRPADVGSTAVERDTAPAPSHTLRPQIRRGPSAVRRRTERSEAPRTAVAKQATPPSASPTAIATPRTSDDGAASKTSPAPRFGANGSPLLD